MCNELKRKAGRKLTTVNGWTGFILAAADTCSWLPYAAPRLRGCFPSFTFQRHFLDSQALGLAQVCKNKKIHLKTNKNGWNQMPQKYVSQILRHCLERISYVSHSGDSSSGTYRERSHFPASLASRVEVTWLVLANERVWAEGMSLITSGLESSES